MNDSTNQANSYVDSYAPPQNSADPLAPRFAAPATTPVVAPIMPATNDVQQTPPTTAAPAAAPAAATPEVSQTLEDQNIFHLLGVQDATDQEKESFLDELQQVIWEDFLENDVELLITENEKTELQAIMAKTYETDLDKQEAIVVYLEKLVPDLEEIMLEKALELKRDMVHERIAGLEEFYKDQVTPLQTISQAKALLTRDRWRDAAEVLNTLK